MRCGCHGRYRYVDDDTNRASNLLPILSKARSGRSGDFETENVTRRRGSGFCKRTGGIPYKTLVVNYPSLSHESMFLEDGDIKRLRITNLPSCIMSKAVVVGHPMSLGPLYCPLWMFLLPSFFPPASDHGVGELEESWFHAMQRTSDGNGTGPSW